MRRKVILLLLTVVVILTAFFATIFGSSRPVLGLDLQGGTSIVLAPVKGSDLSTLDTAVAIIRARVDGLGIAEPNVSRQGNNIVIDLPGVKNAAEADALVGKTAELRFRVVQGSIPYSTSQTSTTVKGATTTTVKGATTTTVKGATTTTVKGATTTTVKGATTTTTKGKASGRVGTIDTVPIAAARPEAVTTTTVKGATTTTVKGATTTTVKGATTTTTKPGAAANDGTCQNGKAVTPDVADKQVILADSKKTACYLLGPTILTGRNVGTATATINPTSAAWEVNVHFKNDDFVKKVAQPYVGKQVAIELDGVVQSAPNINQGITGQDVTISGNFSSKEAHQLALVLRYGSLPIQLIPQTAQSVSPTLGKDQLKAGIVSGLIGLILVALYMIFVYRLLGLVVWTGIGLTALTFFALVSWLSSHQGLTLTLAGVTGIIVSVGVTVDSYVVYFERLKDEVRTGKTVRSSLDTGFRRAFRTIIAADLVSMIGAVVLYLFATSSVRGFAYFLGLSTALDLILAYCFMWPFVSVLARRPALVRMPGVGIGAGLDVPEVLA
ncbi:MAG: preprotein translocase subunit SecD [Actinomycetota bacterium]|nr:preprotein translocase subunit SecD [Actinomycetota bacterium]